MSGMMSVYQKRFDGGGEGALQLQFLQPARTTDRITDQSRDLRNDHSQFVMNDETGNCVGNKGRRVK